MADGTPATPCDLLIRNAHVLTLDDRRTVHPQGAVAIDGVNVVAVGSEHEIAGRFRPRRILDADGAVVHPGFVDAHFHTALHLIRGMYSDALHVDPPALSAGDAFTRWFNALEPEDEYASALVASLEMLRTGTTCFLDPGTTLEPDAVAAAAESAGIRAVVTDPFLWDLDSNLGIAAELTRVPARASRALNDLGGQLWRNADPEGLVHGGVALYGLASSSEELMLAAKSCSDQNQVAYTQHQNFDPTDTTADDRRFGKHALLHLQELGVLGPNCTFVHMNVLRDDEVAAVAESGMSVVWHPGNYVFYAIANSAPNRMPELHRRGVPLAFGADVAKMWDFADMGWLAYLLTRRTGEFLSAEEILAMQTRQGARAVGLERTVGTIEPGKRADLVIRRNDIPEALPGVSPITDLVLLSRSKSVRTVIVNGRVVIKDGRHTMLDEHAVYAQGRKAIDRLMSVTGIAL